MILAAQLAMAALLARTLGVSGRGSRGGTGGTQSFLFRTHALPSGSASGSRLLVPGLIRVAVALPGLAFTQAAGSRGGHQLPTIDLTTWRRADDCDRG